MPGSGEWRETPAERARAGAERILSIPGPHGALFGIFTPPAPESEPAGLCVVMPARTRWRPARMPVMVARRLAARGFGCVRLDCHGHGQSEGETLISARGETNGDDVVAAIGYLRERLAQPRFVLAGYCADALAALAAFPAAGRHIAALVFMAAPILRDPAGVWDRRYVMRAMLDPAKLRRYLRFPRGWTGKLALAGRALTRSDPPAANGCAARFVGGFEFDALVASGARALFLYGSDDPQYLEFRAVQPELWARLYPQARRRIEVEVWPGRAHLPGDVRIEQALYERASEWIAALHPAAEPRFPASNATAPNHE
jgi:pimeloyl-ACP methyl ester carboxylesterase